MATQLRIYTIRQGRMDEFVKVWQEGVVPLRLGQGFRVDGAWVARERSQFIWLLTYDGPEDWETVDKAYYNSPGRAALNPAPAEFIEAIDHTFVTPAVARL